MNGSRRIGVLGVGDVLTGHGGPHDAALVEALLFAEWSGLCPREVLLVPATAPPSSAVSAPARRVSS